LSYIFPSNQFFGSKEGEELMSEVFSSQVFGIMLTMAFFYLGTILYQKTKLPFFSPLLVASVLLILYIEIAKIDLQTFLTDVSGIHVFLGPLIVSLAYPIVTKWELIKKNFLVIVFGSLIGAVFSVLSVLWIAPLFGLSPDLVVSLIPKSSTTPIAIEVSEQLGGIKAITVASVVLSAVIGAMLIPMIVKVLKIKDPRAIGVALGSTSQAIGTAKALEINPEAGAIASVSLVFTGVFTALMLIIL